MFTRGLEHLLHPCLVHEVVSRGQIVVLVVGQVSECILDFDGFCVVDSLDRRQTVLLVDARRVVRCLVATRLGVLALLPSWIEWDLVLLRHFQDNVGVDLQFFDCPTI